MQTAEHYAAQLHAMTSGDSAPEARSIENPSTPITPFQLADIMGYGPTRSGVQINESTAMTWLAFYAAVKVLAESVAMLPMAVFNGDDDEEVKTRAKGHAAYRLLRWRPNEHSTAVTFKEAMQTHLVTWGNAYARILSNNGGDPISLLVLPAGRTYPERKAGKLVYSVDGGGGTFFPEEIIHLPGLSLNGLDGLSPVAYCREAIGSGKATELYGAGFFGNGAAVGGVLEFPIPLTPTQMANMQESWQAKYAGVGNAHKTGIVPFGGKFTRTSIPPEEAQFLESQKFNVNQMARLFRVPGHMLGDLSGSTNNNIEQQSLEFLIYTLMPWLEKWESELTYKLCGDKGEYHVKFDDRRLLRSDATARQAFYQCGRQWGFLNADDCRREEGMPPLPNGQGQIYLSPQNMVPADKAGAVADALVAGKTKPAPPKPEPGDPHIAPGDDARAVSAMRDVFEDAIGRMLRKEANAVGRGKADDAFYEQHGRHVREALGPAVSALLRLSGADMAEIPNEVYRSVYEFAAERHPDLNGDTGALAAAKAAEIPTKILNRITGQL